MNRIKVQGGFKLAPTFEEIKSMRKHFFLKNPIIDLCKKYGCSERVFRQIVKQKQWQRKRERYYIYLIHSAIRNKFTIKHIADIAGIKYNILTRRNRENKLGELTRYNFSPHNKKLNKDIEEKMIKDYLNNDLKLSSGEIAKKYNFKTSKTVCDVLHKNNIKIKNRGEYSDYNVDYFKKIDSHDKAYILGLLLTDGYVIRRYEGIAIQITYSDRDILHKIAKLLGESTSVNKIIVNNKVVKSKDGKPYIRRNMIRLCCFCPSISKDLKKFSMLKRKTMKLFLPDIPLWCYSSFVRGLFDGDGSVGIALDTNFPWARFISASKKFLLGLKYVLENNFNFTISFGKCSPNESTRHPLYYMYIKGGKKKIFAFYKWLYKHKGNLYLRRKYEKVQDKIS